MAKQVKAKTVSIESENVKAALDRIESSAQQIDKDHGTVSNEINRLRVLVDELECELEDVKEKSTTEIAVLKEKYSRQIHALETSNSLMLQKLRSAHSEAEQGLQAIARRD